MADNKTWTITFQRETKDDLEALETSDQNLILDRIMERLSVAPEQYGKILRDNLHPRYRLRVEDYRVIYRVDRAAKTVRILYIAHRKKVYKKATRIVQSRDN